jgi:transcriptional regulator with XRE-family HTH domain
MKKGRSVEVIVDIDVIAKWMKANRWNKSSLARRFKVDPTTMGRWLSGKQNPPYTFILALSALSGMGEETFLRSQQAA